MREPAPPWSVGPAVPMPVGKPGPVPGAGLELTAEGMGLAPRELLGKVTQGSCCCSRRARRWLEPLRLWERKRLQSSQSAHSRRLAPAMDATRARVAAPECAGGVQAGQGMQTTESVVDGGRQGLECRKEGKRGRAAAGEGQDPCPCRLHRKPCPSQPLPPPAHPAHSPGCRLRNSRSLPGLLIGPGRPARARGRAGAV